MKKHLNNERNLVFALALCMFDNDEQMHNHVLQTIYKRLAGTKLDCPRYGNHWQVIGFQGECWLFQTIFITIYIAGNGCICSECRVPNLAKARGKRVTIGDPPVISLRMYV